MSLLLGAGRIAGDGLGARDFGPAPGAAMPAPDTPIDNNPNRVGCSKHFITIVFRFIDTLLLRTRILTPASASIATGYFIGRWIRPGAEFGLGLLLGDCCGRLLGEGRADCPTLPKTRDRTPEFGLL